MFVPSSPTALVARLMGLLIVLVSVAASARCAALIVWLGAWAYPWYEVQVAFLLLGLAAWSLTSLGEWFWSFEGGWWPLQRLLRVIQITTIAGGALNHAILRLYVSWNGL
tara:strand:+ start:349 stop:678 length:330 start_codon:yes stop_codon:yes gene_type:complete